MARRIRSLNRAFGLVLAELRHRSGDSQEKFAFCAGVHRTFVSQIERGIKSPTLNTIVALAAALKVSPHEMLKMAESRAR